MKNLTPLQTALTNLNSIPFHMPGHKRNAALLGDTLPWAMDITEITGFDNLQNPEGMLRDITRRAAAFWGSRAAYLSVNGSTGAIFAAIRAMTQPGDTVLVARNCHMSVFHAVELCQLRPIFLEPEWLPAWGIYGAVAQAAIDQALAAHPEAVLCVITSPSYEGVCSDIACPIPLFVDAAHGAHLPLPNADLACVSLHKTLPALTQTAMLHVMSERVDLPKLEHQLRVFQTSSPSYILMASAEQCVALLETQRDALFAAWEQRLAAFYAHVQRWKHLRLFLPDDRSKLLVQCTAANPYATLQQHHIEPEYIRRGSILFMTSPCDTDDMMLALTNALDELDAQCSDAERDKPQNDPPPPHLSALALPLGKALNSPSETLPAARAIGRVCAEYVWEYPPGIPVLLPGQVIETVPPGREKIRVLKK